VAADKKDESEHASNAQSDVPASNLSRINRREWFKAGASGGVGLALGGLIDVSVIKAATQELLRKAGDG